MKTFTFATLFTGAVFYSFPMSGAIINRMFAQIVTALF